MPGRAGSTTCSSNRPGSPSRCRSRRPSASRTTEGRSLARSRAWTRWSPSSMPLNFPARLGGGRRPVRPGESTGEDDERTVSDLLVDQVEFADVILISKTDLVEEAQPEEVEAVVRGLNPRAKVLRISRGEVPLGEVLDTGLFDMEAAQRSAAWVAELTGTHTPETEEYGDHAASSTRPASRSTRALHRPHPRRPGRASSARRASSGSPPGPTHGPVVPGGRRVRDWTPLAPWWADAPAEEWPVDRRRAGRPRRHLGRAVRRPPSGARAHRGGASTRPTWWPGWTTACCGSTSWAAARRRGPSSTTRSRTGTDSCPLT